MATGVPEVAHPQGLQVLRRPVHAAPGARRDGRGGARTAAGSPTWSTPWPGCSAPRGRARFARRRWRTSSSPGRPTVPQLGRAEVSLTIDNRTGRLPGGLAEITITRTLFRSGESEYAINGQPCRLLDIQEMLSDSGVGRQQHVIVSQGQLGAILDSRPEDRRAVIEEAAGVLKHRRRRERAERRLAATEENLDRLGDLLREVRRQIRPLERQAASARSHASLADELRALRLHLVGRELAGLDARRAAGDRRARSSWPRPRPPSSRRSPSSTPPPKPPPPSSPPSAKRTSWWPSPGSRAWPSAAGVCSGSWPSAVAPSRAPSRRPPTPTWCRPSKPTRPASSAELEATTHEDDALAPQAAEVRGAEHALASDVASHEASFADLAGQRAAEEAYAMARGRIEPLQSSLEREQGGWRAPTSGSGRRCPSPARCRPRRPTWDSSSTQLSSGIPLWPAGPATCAGVADEAERRLRARPKRCCAPPSVNVTGSRRVPRHWPARSPTKRAGRRCRDARRGGRVLGVLKDLVDIDDGWGAAFEAAVGRGVGRHGGRGCRRGTRRAGHPARA